MSNRCDWSSLNRIGDDCFRLILQYTQIQTMVAISLISRRTYEVTNHVATKYLPIIQLDLSQTDLCQRYAKTRMSAISRKLRLTSCNSRRPELMVNPQCLELMVMVMIMIIQRAKYLLTLDLGWNQIGIIGMRSLTRCFAFIPQLQTLDLTYNRMGLEAMSVLASHLPSLPCLQTLNLDANYMGAEAMSVLASHLTSLPCLQTLHLGFNHLGDEGIRVLAPHLSSCPCLQILTLNDNHLCDEEVSAEIIEDIKSMYPNIDICF